MYGNYIGQVPPINQLDRQIEDLQRIKEQYRQPIQPINNIINTNQPNNIVELKQLKENQDVSDLYIQNKTIFKNDKEMVIKDVEGNIEKYEIKKIFPLDEKDLRISELEARIKELEGVEDDESKNTTTTKTSKK